MFDDHFQFVPFIPPARQNHFIREANFEIKIEHHRYPEPVSETLDPDMSYAHVNEKGSAYENRLLHL